MTKSFLTEILSCPTCDDIRSLLNRREWCPDCNHTGINRNVKQTLMNYLMTKNSKTLEDRRPYWRGIVMGLMDTNNLSALDACEVLDEFNLNEEES